jgi:hypothetical protein
MTATDGATRATAEKKLRKMLLRRREGVLLMREGHSSTENLEN